MDEMGCNVDDGFGKLISRAEQVLAERWGTRVQLGNVQRLSEERRRNLLLRCQVLGGPADAPPDWAGADSNGGPAQRG